MDHLVTFLLRQALYEYRVIADEKKWKAETTNTEIEVHCNSQYLTYVRYPCNVTAKNISFQTISFNGLAERQPYFIKSLTIKMHVEILFGVRSVIDGITEASYVEENKPFDVMRDFKKIFGTASCYFVHPPYVTY